jgi:hypothetical protein
MKFKRKLRITASTVAALLICFALLKAWVVYHKGNEIVYPINLGSFPTIGSAVINPATLLEEIKTGKEPLLLRVQTDTPDGPPFIMSVGWSQSEYLEIAKAYQKAIWKDDPTEWHLYKAIFDATCENDSNKFRGADLYYFRPAGIKYAARDILIQPEHGYIAWGEGASYPRSFLVPWTEINMESITKVPAEKALELAGEAGGNEFRNTQNKNCSIGVSTWPWGYNRSDWMVTYSGTDNREFWIPVK